MQTNATGRAIVRRFEGLSLNPYRCPAGKVTVGFGHVVLDTEPELMHGVTETEADALLLVDLRRAERAVEKWTDVALTSNQFSALASLVFNIGAGNFASSTLRTLLNQGRTAEAAAQFDRWVYAGKVRLPGLVARRAAEKALFLTPDTSRHDL